MDIKVSRFVTPVTLYHGQSHGCNAYITLCHGVTHQISSIYLNIMQLGKL